MRPLNVLVGCERSGIVRDAFRRLGHNAWSCDIEPSLTSEGGYHLEGDVRWWLDGDAAVGSDRGWDLFIVHPPCTYLCSSGMHWNGRVPGRAEKTEAALAFVRELIELSAHIPHVAIENPVGCIGRRIRPADQYVQPYEFGDDASKRTGLWLRDLPLLVPTKRVPGRIVTCNGKRVERWANQTDSGQNRLGPSAERATLRSNTYPGIAGAIARQWSDYINRRNGQ